MSSKSNNWYQPKVTIQNGAIAITDSTHSLKLGLQEVRKMYISKHKPGYFSTILKHLWFQESSYDLHIQTKDSEEIKIRIKDMQRQYYIALIARVRSKILLHE